MFKRFLGGAVSLLFFIAPLPAKASDCWDTVVELQETGFDFVIESQVQGPSSGGAYTYTYHMYRIDQGSVTYRDPSHITLQFACDSEPSGALIIGGVEGITFSGSYQHIDVIEVADSPFGFNEPGLGQDCPTNGLKFEFKDGALIPDGDGVSYPTDLDDPVLTFSFISLAPPEEGLWFTKGGRSFRTGANPGSASREVTYLTDGGTILVPECRPPVAVSPSSWGVLKQLYP